MNQEKVWNDIAPEWSKFRTKSVEYIDDFLKNQKGKIADFACGSARNLIKIKNARFYCIDFSKRMLDYAKEKAEKNKIDAEFIQSDLSKLNFEDNFFDSAICISALHCLDSSEKREKAAKEMFRVMKKGEARC